MLDDVVMSDVKKEDVVNRITMMAAELHFSVDRSSISGMKAAEVTNWSWRTWMTTKLTAKFAKMGQIFFNNKVSNDTDENLNWRNVKQKVPT